MNDQITVCGHVATDPKHHSTDAGLDITSFRLASQQRRYDAKQGAWVDLEANWYTVSAFRSLATAAAGSLVKGQRVVVVGRVRIRDWESGERRGTSIGIEADVIGSDIGWQPRSTTNQATARPLGAPDAEPVGGGAVSWATAPPQETPF